MKTSGIPFKGPMVRAILEGRKTQTRRLVQPQPSPCGLRKLTAGDVAATGLDARLWYGADPYTESQSCPYGGPGDRLWVRETWQQCPACRWWEYRADVNKPNNCRSCDATLGKWKPSIFMPRAIARITLEITGVRVERLQDISEEDAMAEGWSPADGQGPCEWYEDLWNTINGKPHVERNDEGVVILHHDYSWEANPWVWVIEFRRMTQ